MRILILQHNGEIIGAYRNEKAIKDAIMDAIEDQHPGVIGNYRSNDCRVNTYVYEHVFRTTIVVDIPDTEE